MMTVAWIFRKPQPFYFSIEKVFYLVSGYLEGKPVSIKKVYMPYHRFTAANLLRNLLFTKKVSADLYHITGDVNYVVYSLPGKQTILTIHDCVFMYQNTGLKRTLLYYFLLKWPVERCAVITTVSEQSRRDIIKFTKCPADKIIVIPDPLDERFAYSPKSFNESCPVLLFVGITPNKNLSRVIDALDDMQCILHVIGKIPDLEKQKMIEKRIVFRESVGLSDKEMKSAYIEADVVVFPSLFEGFGLPIVEAQQTGRPVVTSNISPMKEVAGEGASLVDPYQVNSIRAGIVKVIEDAEYRNTLIKTGLKNALRFKPEQIAESYLTLYHSLQSSLS